MCGFQEGLRLTHPAQGLPPNLEAPSLDLGDVVASSCQS